LEGVLCLCMLFDIEAPSLNEIILNAALELLFYVCGHGFLFQCWYNEDQHCEKVLILEIEVRRAEGWCEIVASLRGCEPRSRRTSTVGRRYQPTQWRSWLRTLSLFDSDLWSVITSCVQVSNISDCPSKPHLQSRFITWKYVRMIGSLFSRSDKSLMRVSYTDFNFSVQHTDSQHNYM
jgi:hypothetical protein